MTEAPVPDPEPAERPRHVSSSCSEILAWNGIITGHSNKTGSDGYGGERPPVLMTANESICKDLLDADLRTAIARPVTCTADRSCGVICGVYPEDFSCSAVNGLRLRPCSSTAWIPCATVKLSSGTPPASGSL